MTHKVSEAVVSTRSYARDREQSGHGKFVRVCLGSSVLCLFRGSMIMCVLCKNVVGEYDETSPSSRSTPN